MCAACKAQPAFEWFAGIDLGIQNAPRTPEQKEMYRRLFVAGWRAPLKVSRWTHLKRAMGWNENEH